MSAVSNTRSLSISSRLARLSMCVSSSQSSRFFKDRFATSVEASFFFCCRPTTFSSSVLLFSCRYSICITQSQHTGVCFYSDHVDYRDTGLKSVFMHQSNHVAWRLRWAISFSLLMFWASREITSWGRPPWRARLRRSISSSLSSTLEEVFKNK